MFRRRLSQNIKMALYVAHFASNKAENITKSVFASRFGEWQQTVKLLEAYCIEDTISPAGFGLSVHNAAAGLASVIYGNKKPYVAIAAGENTISVAMLEALLSIDDGDVLFVYSDEASPELYKALDTRPQCAVGMVLSCKASSDALHVRCTMKDGGRDSPFELIEFCTGALETIALGKIHLEKVL
jgi:hypothetical protein